MTAPMIDIRRMLLCSILLVGAIAARSGARAFLFLLKHLALAFLGWPVIILCILIRHMQNLKEEAN